MLDGIMDMVRREVWRIMHHQKTTRPGVITSIDPDTYSAKVRYEPHDPNDPDNAESGWIPIQAVAVGQGYGIYSMPQVGQQVDVAFHQGDHETGRIVQRHNSEANQPPQGMKEGEYWTVHANGAVQKFLADGTVFIGGAGTVPNRGSKDPATGKDGQVTGQQPQGKQAITLNPDGSFSFAHKSGGQIAMDASGNVTVSSNGKNVTVDAGAGGIAYKGASHTFQGGMSVTGNIAVTGSVTATQAINGMAV